MIQREQLTYDRMERFNFPYSLKNIPIPPSNTYKKTLIDKTENFIGRIRWATDAFLFPDKYVNKKQTFGFKTSKTAPFSPLLKNFEDDVYNLIANVQFHERAALDPFQKNMAAAVKNINKSDKLFIFGDKTSNIYQVSREKYNDLLLNNITKDYRQVNTDKIKEVNREAKDITEKLEIADRVEVFSDALAFLSIKDHKPNYETDTKCRLINPAKSQIGIISREILQKHNKQIRENLKLNQWQSTDQAIEWFNLIEHKADESFYKWMW